ncbi:hypothetical protein H920_18145 [Fukomys damarensis]|uniref:Uncharacterized protein n=1 Tax=Fukomys damarensis TaxID=885580 RepID=A0A091CSL9_FUKDA|nr:hypothetical protein H920_18145 [Fukomys damarensis]
MSLKYSLFHCDGFQTADKERDRNSHRESKPRACEGLDSEKANWEGSFGIICYKVYTGLRFSNAAQENVSAFELADKVQGLQKATSISERRISKAKNLDTASDCDPAHHVRKQNSVCSCYWGSRLKSQIRIQCEDTRKPSKSRAGEVACEPPQGTDPTADNRDENCTRVFGESTAHRNLRTRSKMDPFTQQ